MSDRTPQYVITTDFQEDDIHTASKGERRRFGQFAAKKWPNTTDVGRQEETSNEWVNHASNGKEEQTKCDYSNC